ncbi:hypothetical protein P4576_02615 [Peribacillus frigoritolerans]|uniref:hypothetical protein n=1 Tax=Peribacillus frigoritolerans TaxID=450367 RepID=UPI002E24FC3A|nr:hypothetical protein [Peribacillus frigoritolerans]
MERKVRDSCGKRAAWETPQRRAEEAPARGKRVPEVEINVPILQTHFVDKRVLSK